MGAINSSLKKGATAGMIRIIRRQWGTSSRIERTRSVRTVCSHAEHGNKYYCSEYGSKYYCSFLVVFIFVVLLSSGCVRPRGRPNRRWPAAGLRGHSARGVSGPSKSAGRMSPSMFWSSRAKTRTLSSRTPRQVAKLSRGEAVFPDRHGLRGRAARQDSRRRRRE